MSWEQMSVTVVKLPGGGEKLKSIEKHKIGFIMLVTAKPKWKKKKL